MSTCDIDLILTPQQVAVLCKMVKDIDTALCNAPVNSNKFVVALDNAEVMHSFLNTLNVFGFLLSGACLDLEARLFASEDIADERCREYLDGE